jgi:hypothetical protein
MPVMMKMRNIGTLDDEYVQKVLYRNIHQPVMLMDILYQKRYIKPYSRSSCLQSIWPPDPIPVS